MSHAFLDSRRLTKFGLLSLVAVLGSVVFGAVWGFAALLTLSTGCAWVVFGLSLWAVTRKPILVLAEVCLVTMAYGEAVLVPSAVILKLAGLANSTPDIKLAPLLAADVVMAAVFASQLGREGIPKRTSVGLWILVLNGSWAVFLWLIPKVLPAWR